MKKIASVLIFIFMVQMTMPAFAQSNSGINQKQLEDCYGKLFDKFSTAVSDDVGQKVEYTAEKRLLFLQTTAYLLSNVASEKIKKHGKRVIYVNFNRDVGTIIGSVLGLVTVVGSYKFYKLRGPLPGALFAAVVGLFSFQSFFIPRNMKIENLDFSYELPISFESLIRTKTEHDFFTQVATNHSSGEKMSQLFLDHCQEILKTDIQPVLEKVNGITEEQWKQISTQANK